MKMKLIALCLAVATLSGCAVFDSRPPEEVVAERAQLRLDLLMAQDFESAYELTTPGYRAVNNLTQYKIDFAGSQMWTEAGIAQVECQAVGEAEVTGCKVMALISYKPPRAGYIQTTEVTESWVLLDRRWYLMPK